MSHKSHFCKTVCAKCQISYDIVDQETSPEWIMWITSDRLSMCDFNKVNGIRLGGTWSKSSGSSLSWNALFEWLLLRFTSDQCSHAENAYNTSAVELSGVCSRYILIYKGMVMESTAIRVPKLMNRVGGVSFSILPINNLSKYESRKPLVHCLLPILADTF